MTEIIGTPGGYYTPGIQPSKEEMGEAADMQMRRTNVQENGVSVSQENSQTTEAKKLPENKKVFTDVKEVSLTFNRGESFDYIGSDRRLSDLDIQKAISDMRKDKVLEEYQYFVGGKPDLEYDEDIDGAVFRK